jgi:hypothetical protein
MLTTMALAAALAVLPAQAPALNLTHIRPTHGVLGPTRSSLDLLPGDTLYVAFDIEGITCDPEGKVRYSMATELTDSTGKSVFKQPAQELDTMSSLGGNQLAAFAVVDVGPSQPAGNYTLKVTVTDPHTKQSKSFTQDFKVLPKAFGLVRLTGSPDADGQVPCGLMTVGQPLWMHGLVVGFDRDKTSKQPKVALEMQIFDDQNKPTTTKPFTGMVDKGIRPEAAGVPVQFLVSLNRPGKFTMKLTATDQLTGKSVSQSFPFTVHARQ